MRPRPGPTGTPPAGIAPVLDLISNPTRVVIDLVTG